MPLVSVCTETITIHACYISPDYYWHFYKHCMCISGILTCILSVDIYYLRHAPRHRYRHSCKDPNINQSKTDLNINQSKTEVRQINSSTQGYRCSPSYRNHPI